MLRASKHRLHALRGAYAGQRTFLMGNGPSLNETPLDLLADEYVWGFNRCHLLFERVTWRPAFYVATDLELPDLVRDIRDMLKTLPDTLFFFPAHFYLQGALPDHPSIVWYSSLLFNPDEDAPGYFSFDAPRFVRAASTVVIEGMQFAAHLGFNPLYLIGCDTSYTHCGVSHFDPRYGITMPPDTHLMHTGYQQAHRMCAANGVAVYNATVGGVLEAFPRVALTDTLNTQKTAYVHV